MSTCVTGTEEVTIFVEDAITFVTGTDEEVPASVIGTEEEGIGFVEDVPASEEDAIVNVCETGVSLDEGAMKTLSSRIVVGSACKFRNAESSLETDPNRCVCCTSLPKKTRSP